MTALVQIGDLEVPYRRAGHGPAVLLLAPSARPEERRGLLDRLASRYRVVEPTALPAGDDWNEWLRGVIDGLGLERIESVPPGALFVSVLRLSEGRFVREDVLADVPVRPGKGEVMWRALAATDADIVVFDPETVEDHATFEDPMQLATGVRDVFVNGTAVLRDGEHTGAMPGRVVRGPGWSGWPTAD